MNKENTDGIRELIGNLKQEAVEEYKKEHGIGWIPCSERMPEEKSGIFVNYMGIEMLSPLSHTKLSDVVKVTVELSNETRIVDIGQTIGGKWACDTFIIDPEAKVIAWMPDPEPYMGE